MTIHHLVLTGGPAAGKTTALAHLVEHLTGRGWRVLTVPEAATVLIGSGLDDIGHLAAHDRPTYLAAQSALVELQLGLHATYQHLADGFAATGAKVVVLHDRGIADNAAYMTHEEYENTLATHGLTPTGAHELYDSVIHLRSAAVPDGNYDGSGYTTANNTARTETAAQAAHLDESTLSGWATHRHLAVIGAHGDFAAKLTRTLTAVAGALGDPEPLEIERKFLLATTPDLTHPVLAAAPTVDIFQTYLPSTVEGEQRVRSRTVAGVTTFTHTTKSDVDSAVRVEVETPLGEEKYRLMLGLADPDTVPVTKTRRVFVVGNQRFELDELHSPVTGWLLEVELITTDDPVAVPAFLGPVTEVTDDPAWRNRSLATATH